MKRWPPHACAIEMASAQTLAIGRRQALVLLAGAVSGTHATAGPRRVSHFLFGSPVELVLPPATPQASIDAVMSGMPGSLAK
jgi:hypothetical protein